VSWPLVKLGELVEIKGGGTPSKQVEEYWNGHIPWASVKDFKSSVLYKTEDCITQAGVDNSATNIISAGTIIVPTRMALGKVALTGCDMAINQDLKALLIKDEKKICTKFLLRFLESKADYIEAQGQGATVKGIKLDVLRGLETPLPPLPEQKRIATILDKADQLRQKRRQAINLTDEFLRSVFLEMFGDPESAGWDLVTVESLLANHKGSMRTGPFGSQLLHSEFTDSGIAVLGIDNAVKNVFKWAKPRFISGEKYQQLKKYTVYPGDVLITIMGTCGRCAVVPDDITPAINTKHLCAITLDQSKCLPRFLHSYFLMHPAAKKYLAAKAKGAIMSGLNMGVIKELPVPAAPLALQQKYQAVCQKYDHIITNLNVASQISGDNFNSLSQKAFAGQL